MLSSPRRFLAVLVAFVLAVPVACAQGDPRVVDPTPSPTSTVEKTEPPPAPTSTTEKPKPPANPDEALPPVVTSVSPNKATVGSVGPSITVSGNNFVARSIVQLDGVPLATSFVNGNELRATIPTTKLATTGVMRLSVGTSPPGGGASKEVTFEVQNPTPRTTSIDPLSAIAGAGPTAIHVEGSGFVSGAKIVFGSTDLTTTFTSATELDATIPASLLNVSASVPVKVVNPAPGGGASSAIAFTIANPSASIQSINPSAAFVGSAAFTMTVNGSGFVTGSSVVFNGTTLATTFVNTTKLEAAVPAASLGAAGDFPVAINNPPPGGGVSLPVVFRVQYPTPSVSALAPSSAGVGAGPTDVTVTGLGFFLTSQITFDGAPAATTYLDATHLKATLSAAQLASAGSISVRVVNGAPGGGMSPALSFSVNNALPTITTLNPASVTAGSSDKTLTITGTGFVPTSTVKSNGVNVSATFVSGTTLSAVVPSAHLLNPGTVAITVTNPAPGGGTSAVKNLVVGCDGTGVDVALGPVGTITVLPTNFATAPLMSRFVESSSCAITAIDPAQVQPGRYWVVQNTSGASITLSAWADCTASGKQDDAYLTFYKRPTPPASDAERLACAFTIAEGINGEGGYSSPDRGVSNWCPGLTKANGGGLPLAACEKAVVHIQPWSFTSTTYTPPPTIKFKAE
ncbi:MAG: hypothetical protein JST00_30590 [Deltaproteobacteria bacterium]|nr:hypothetical protein [Deltaproteobacteria bacterium]